MNNVNGAPVALPYPGVLDARVHDRQPFQEEVGGQNAVPYNEEDPYLGIPLQERISLPLTRPLWDYPAVYPQAPHCQLEKIAQTIFDRYNLTQQQFVHQIPEGHELKVKVLAYDAEKIYQTMKTWATIGAIGGGVLAEGTYVLATRDPHIWNHVQVISLGATAGGVVGSYAGRFFAKRALRQETYVALKIPDIYKEWQKGLTKETYELYHAIYKNYQLNDTSIENFVCSISCHLPLIPVKAHDGGYYEKAAIENWLDIKQAERDQLHLKKQGLEDRISDLLASLTLIPALEKDFDEHVDDPAYIQKMKEILFDHPLDFHKLKTGLVDNPKTNLWLDVKEKEIKLLQNLKMKLEEEILDFLYSLSPKRNLKQDLINCDTQRMEKEKEDLLEDPNYFQKLKESLVYEPKHVNEIIVALKKLIANQQINPNKDDLLNKAVTARYNYYIRMNQEIDIQLKTKFVLDLNTLGATHEQIIKYSYAMQDHFDLKKENEKDQEIALLRQQLNSRQASAI